MTKQPNQALFEVVPDLWIGRALKKSAYRIQFSSDFAYLESGAPGWAGFQSELERLKSSPSFFYTKIDPKCVRLVKFLENLEFFVVDTNMSFEKNLGAAPLLRGASEIREAKPADEQQVTDLAGRSFVFSRFHLDPLVDLSVANQLKGEWVQNYFRGTRGNDLIVSILNDRIVGFNQLLVQGEQVVIDLIGVDSDVRRKGIASDLISFVENKYRHLKKYVVGTQVANIPSMRLYENLGFRIKEAKHVLHAHFGS